MGNDIVEQKSFQERMKDRIRADIGDLITDEELTKLIQDGVEDVFLSPIVEKRGWDHIEKPSLLHGLIKELLTEQVRSAVDIYLKDHNKEAMAVISEVVTFGMGKALMAAIRNTFEQDLLNLECNIRNKLQGN